MDSFLIAEIRVEREGVAHEDLLPVSLFVSFYQIEPNDKT